MITSHDDSADEDPDLGEPSDSTPPPFPSRSPRSWTDVIPDLLRIVLVIFLVLITIPIVLILVLFAVCAVTG